LEARQSKCSDAILFTVNGAKRVADLCWQVFDVIDSMYPKLIRTGWLEACILTHPLFCKDFFVLIGSERPLVKGLADITALTLKMTRLRGGGKRGWCEEWARSGWDHPTFSYH
jgi:hypothetical protein